jgi:hypothetical protein
MFALVVAVSITALVIETRTLVPEVRPPDRHEWVAVNNLLRSRPQGLTVELPAVSGSGGFYWGYIEAPRMFLARRDGHPRMNGYSGFDPPGFERTAEIVNDFPSAQSVAWLRRVGVKYVIVRKGIVGNFEDWQRELLVDGQPEIDYTAISELLVRRPKWAKEVRAVGSAILVLL